MAAALDEPDWSRLAAGLSAPGGPADPAGAPTYGALAVTGIELVERLAAAGRWDDAHPQAAFLADYFMAARRQLHPVAGVAFQGLCDAVRARDTEELAEHAEFLREIFAS